VIPRWRRGLLDGESPELDDHPGLADWWREAEQLWEQNKGKANRLTLRERLDFQRGVTNQFPIAAHRVLYTQSGNQIAAARLESSDALIEHKLYWAAVGSAEEARYLVAIFNSGPLFKAVEPLMSEGLFGKRDIDKYVFAAPVPFYDADDIGHSGLARLGERAERVAAAVELSDDWGFQKCRRVVREALAEDGVALEIDAAVAELLAIGLTEAPAKSGTHSASATDLMHAFSKAEGETLMPRTRSILADVDRPQPPDTARRKATKNPVRDGA
jgi:hypothetical protein